LAKIHGIYKGGKPPNPLNYYPPASRFKLLTKTLSTRMMDLVERENFFIRKEISTANQIHAVRGIIEEGKKLGKRLHVTYIDLAGAYDSFLGQTVQTLKAYGPPPPQSFNDWVDEQGFQVP